MSHPIFLRGAPETRRGCDLAESTLAGAIPELAFRSRFSVGKADGMVGCLPNGLPVSTEYYDLGIGEVVTWWVLEKPLSSITRHLVMLGRELGPGLLLPAAS